MKKVVLLLKVSVVFFLLIKIFFLIFYRNIIYIQAQYEVLQQPHEIEIIMNKKRYYIELDDTSVLQPEVIFYKIEPHFIKLKIRDKFQGTEKNITFSPIVFQWLLIEVSSDEIKVKKYFFPPIFQ